MQIISYIRAAAQAHTTGNPGTGSGVITSAPSTSCLAGTTGLSQLSTTFTDDNFVKVTLPFAFQLFGESTHRQLQCMCDVAWSVAGLPDILMCMQSQASLLIHLLAVPRSQALGLSSRCAASGIGRQAFTRHTDTRRVPCHSLCWTA